MAELTPLELFLVRFEPQNTTFGVKNHIVPGQLFILPWQQKKTFCPFSASIRVTRRTFLRLFFGINSLTRSLPRT